ncbi:MAG: outer membrane beta-barrel protein [Thermodesulfobacteriota bacterium]|nr:outer membrane beta-barrel protein [Thermodesulfobacteriota bacterium]
MKRLESLFTLMLIFLMLAICLPAVGAPLQSTSGNISGDIFGRKNRIFHPSIMVSGEYTDNLYNSYTDEDEDFITVISPKLTLAFPGTDETEIRINTATGAPGGLMLSRDMLETTNRFQGILSYTPEFEIYSDNTDENFTRQTLQGAFQYNAPGGLTLDIADQYRKDQEMRGEIGNQTGEEFESNLANGAVKYEFSPKFSIGANVTAYAVSYSTDTADFRDRNDTAVGGAFYYNITEKTEIFTEYKYIDVSYDAAVSADRENTEDQILAGITWRMTTKSRGTCKIGYAEKDFEGAGVDDPTGWYAELNAAHKFTTRTMLQLGAVHRFSETNLSTSAYYTTDAANMVYSQELTPKLQCRGAIRYSVDDYDGVDLELKNFGVRPSVAFLPYRWLTIDLAYDYEKRDATIDILDYTTNSVILSVDATF